VASALDPFGNLFSIIENPHFQARRGTLASPRGETPMSAQVFLKLKKAKDANPKLWSAKTLEMIRDHGDGAGVLQELIIKRWKLGIEEACEAGAELHLFADDHVIGYRVFTADKSLQKIIDAKMKTAVESKLPKKAAPEKQKSAGLHGTDKAVQKTIKIVTAGGQVASVTVFVLSAAAVAGLSLNPITAPLAALGLLNQGIGILIGIAEKRKRWGTEVNKSALARLGEWGKQKMHLRRLQALKEKGGDSVAARADYCAVLQADINTLKRQLNEFRERADTIIEEAGNARKIADQAQAKIAEAEQEVQARARASQPISQDDAATLETVAAKYDELADYKVKYMLESQDDLWGRGAPTINEISAKIAEMESDIREATTGPWFENAAQKLFPTGGPGALSSRTAEVAAEEAPEMAMTLANIGAELAEVIGDCKVSGILSILNELKGVVVSVGKIAVAARENRAQWDVMDKGIVQKMEDWWNRRQEAKRRAGTDPAAFADWQQLAMQHLADMKEELAKVKERQTVAEQVSLNASTRINDLYSEQVEKVKEAETSFEDVRKKSQRIVKITQEFFGKYKDLDKNEKQTLMDQLKQAAEAQAEMAKALADAQKNLGMVETFCLKKKEECMNVLNEGLDQSINEKQKAIDDLEAELAAATR
jgi:hypothetical protein